MRPITPSIAENGNVTNQAASVDQLRETIIKYTDAIIKGGPNSLVSSEHIPVVLNDISEILNGLSSGDRTRCDKALVELSSRNESNLYHQIGTLARSIHESLIEFRSSLSPGLEKALIYVPDASDKLEQVIKMTEEAAHKTLAVFEEQARITESSTSQINEIKETCTGLPTPKVWSQINDFLVKQLELNTKLRRCNLEGITSQEYQDLAGQALKKVMKVVSEIEISLVKLVSMFGHKSDGGSTTTEANSTEENPQLAGQDDIDSLLKDFGF